MGPEGNRNLGPILLYLPQDSPGIRRSNPHSIHETFPLYLYQAVTVFAVQRMIQSMYAKAIQAVIIINDKKGRPGKS